MLRRVVWYAHTSQDSGRLSYPGRRDVVDLLLEFKGKELKGMDSLPSFESRFGSEISSLLIRKPLF